MSDEANAAFAAEVEKQTAAMQQAGLDPNTGLAAGQTHHSQQPVVQIDPAVLDFVKSQHNSTDENGRRLYASDSEHRERVDRAYQLAFAGGSQADVEKVLAGNAPVAQPAQPVVEPQGTPADRLIERIEQGDVIGADEVPPELWSDMTSGYVVNLPKDYGLSASDICDLQAARAAGLTQGQVDAIVADRLKG